MNKNLMEAAHEMATDLYGAGVIDMNAMRRYDELCFPPIHALKPKQIKRIRLHEKVSEAVFAKYLNTTVSTVRGWEQGKKHPRGIALRVLNLIAEKGLAVLI